MRNRNTSTDYYLKKKKEKFFNQSKKFFSQQIYNVITQIKVLYFCVAIIGFIDIIIGLIMKMDKWQIYFLTSAQIIISIFVIGSVKIWPLNYGTINSIACIIIHSIWAVQQQVFQKLFQTNNDISDVNNKVKESYFKAEGYDGFSYMIGILSFLMISNTNNLTAKIILIIFNVGFYCGSHNIPYYHFHYIVIIVLTIFYVFYCDDRGREQIIREAEWVYELKNVLPNSILVVEYDRKKTQIDLHMSNEKARCQFNLNGTSSNFIDFCKHVTIQKKKTEEISESLFQLEQSNKQSLIGDIKNSNNEIKISSQQYKFEKIQDQSKNINLHDFLLEKFLQLEEETLQKVLQKQTSMEKQDKKSTKTHTAAGFTQINGMNITENTNKAGYQQQTGSQQQRGLIQQISKSLFGQSKTFINMLTTQKSQRKMMMPHHPTETQKQIISKFEEYVCTYHRNSQIINQQQQKLGENKQIEEDGGDMKFNINLSVYTCIDDYFIIMSLDEQNTKEKDVVQNRQSFFFEEFCKQSLLKSTNLVVELVQEIKSLMHRSSIITELDLSRFVNSNLYIAESGLSNNLKPANSNLNTGITGSHLTNHTTSSQKAIYCIPKRQFDNTLQLGIIASSIISNNVNYFALRYLNHIDVDDKPFSITKVIRIIQKMFQKQIDQKNIQILINSQECNISNSNSNVNTATNIINHPTSNMNAKHNNNNINNPNNLNNNINNSVLNNSNLSINFNNINTSVNQQQNSSKDNIIFNNNGQSVKNNQGQYTAPFNNPTQMVYQFLQQQKSCDEICNDESKFQHIIFNLFQNAIENTPQFGTIAFLIQRDQFIENCIKIRIRNKCHPNYYFPFLDPCDLEINLGWREMLNELDQNGKFYFGIRMAAKISQLIGPFNSLRFRDINNQELQAEFLITNYSNDPANGVQIDQSNNIKSFEETSSFVDYDKQHIENQQKPQSRAAKIRCNSMSSHRVRNNSTDSFDKWINIQNLESQKCQNTLKIRNQLKYKN